MPEFIFVTHSVVQTADSIQYCMPVESGGNTVKPRLSMGSASHSSSLLLLDQPFLESSGFVPPGGLRYSMTDTPQTIPAQGPQLRSRTIDLTTSQIWIPSQSQSVICNDALFFYTPTGLVMGTLGCLGLNLP
jgi:hypothetical protein